MRRKGNEIGGDPEEKEPMRDVKPEYSEKAGQVVLDRRDEAFLTV